MKRRRWVILMTTVLVVVGGTFAWLSQPPEPSYNGRKLSEWMQDISPTMRVAGGRPVRLRMRSGINVLTLSEPVLSLPWGGVVSNVPNLVVIPSGAAIATYPPQHEAAAAAIRKIGTNAIPHLLRTIYSRDGKLKTKCIEWSRKQTLVNLPLESAQEKQMYALPALRELGALALWVWVEVATNRLASQEVQSYAAHRLRELGREAMPALRPIMLMEDHPEPGVRIPIRLAIPEILTSADRNARATEMWSLGFMCEDPDKTIPILVAALKDASPLVRQEALLAIAKFGTNAISATNAIQRVMEDPDPGVRSTATNVLRRVLTL